MVNYHCIAVGYNNDSRKSNKLIKYPNMVDEIFHPNRSEFWHAVCSRHFTDGEPTDAHPVVY